MKIDIFDTFGRQTITRLVNTFAARSEGCRETDLWSWSAWSRDTGFIQVSLAYCRATCDVQTLCSYTPHSYRMQSVVSIWTSHVDLQYRISFLTSFCEQSTLWATCNLSQVGRAFAGPAAWNSLPTSLHQITNYKAFKRELTIVLFERANSA